MSEWKPRYVVQKAEGIGGDPIPEDEPCLVIRAQDMLALQMLALYLAKYADIPAADPQVLADLAEHYVHLARWQRKHPKFINGGA